MTTLRFPVAGVWGAICTVALFALLARLVNVPMDVPQPLDERILDFTTVRPDTPVATSPRQKPERTHTPPGPGRFHIDVPREPPERPTLVRTVVIKPPPPGRNPPIGIDRDVLPLVRQSPDYPARALTQNLEGWVQVQFTITATGAVKDAFVVDASPRNVFDAAALKAIARWRYNPRVDDGVPVERVGMQTVIRFELENTL